MVAAGIGAAAYQWLENYWAGIGFGAVGLIWLGTTYLEHRIEEHVVTTDRVISRKGIIRRDVFVYPLESIEAIDVQQGLLGRLFGYGTVEIHTAAETHGVGGREHIHEPDRWRENILRAMKMRSERQGISEQENSELVGKMRQLNQLREEGLIREEEYEEKRQELLDEV